MIRRVVGGAVALLMVVAGLGLGPSPAQAATDGKLVMVLDSSGSMKEKVGGESKIGIAKASLQTVIEKLPTDAQVGLRVYGATVFDKSERGACTDSQLVVPIGTGNRAELRSQVQKYRPYGETPISYSLLQAAKDLGTDGKRTILLVSDGEETCAADPCQIAAQIARQGIDLKIDVVGLAVSGRVRDQLRCIAEKGRGTYYDADDGTDLEDSLDKLATRAFRPFRVTGTPVKGSLGTRSAPTIGAGQYVDTAPANNKRLHYLIRRTIPGSTLRVGFTALVDQTAKDWKVGTVSPRFYGDDGLECGTSLLSQGITVAGSVPLVGGEADSWEDDPASRCFTGDLLLKIFTYDLAGRPFELVVTEEPPVSDPGPGAGTDRIVWQTMSGLGAVRAAPVPGTSFSDAGALSQGRYRGRILSGENQVFAVQLGWGQRLQVEAVIPPRRGALRRAIDWADHLDVQLFGAMRGEYVSLAVAKKPTWSTLVNTSNNAPFRTGGTTAAVRYLNRTATDRAHAASIPGTQYIALGMSRNDPAYLVPYELRVKIIGTAGAGAPRYVQTATPSPSPSAGTASPSGSPGASSSPTQAESPTTGPTPGPPAGPPGWLLIAIGVVILVFVFTGGANRLAKRFQQPPPP